jgi:hypothetical protein
MRSTADGGRFAEVLRLARALQILFVSTLLACGTDSTSNSPQLAGGGDASLAQPGSSGAVGQKNQPAGGGQEKTLPAGSNGCLECLTGACASAVAGCNGDPDCATFLACLDACPTDASGHATQACASNCPRGSSSSGALAESQLNACLTAGAGTVCPSCVAPTSPAPAPDAGMDSGTPSPPSPSEEAGTDAEASSDAGWNPDAEAEPDVDVVDIVLRQVCPSPTNVVNSCDLCEQTHCCVTKIECQDNPDCIGYLNCVGPCSSSSAPPAGASDAGGGLDAGDGDAAPAVDPGACEQACEQQFPNNGATAWAELSSCVVVYCTSPTGCNTSASDCQMCLISNCPSQFAAYSGTADGVALQFCISGCSPTDLNCEMSCYEQHPSSIGAASDLTSCTLSMCPVCLPH